MIKIMDKVIIIKKGDITKENTDAIINPANGALKHGGGAAAAIVRAGGLQIQRDSDSLIAKLGVLPSGKAVITDAYKLPCKFVIHTVGPHMGEGNEDEKLELAVKNSLSLANSYNLNSISMPAISSGIFGFPKEKCAKILLKTCISILNYKDTSLKTVVMCNYDFETYNIFLKAEKAYLNKLEKGESYE